MYKLDAIGEAHDFGALGFLVVRYHPVFLLPLIGDVFKNLRYKETLDNFQIFYDRCLSNPELFLNKDEHNGFLQPLIEDMGFVYQRKDCEQIIMEAVDCMINIVSNEFKIIKEGHYTAVYLEGDNKKTNRVIGNFAERNNRRVIYLDYRNPSYRYIEKHYNERMLNKDFDPYENIEDHEKRESIWVNRIILASRNRYFPRINAFIPNLLAERIQPSPELESSLIIIGAEHLDNRFGFCDKLETRGVELRKIYDFSEIFERFDKSLNELERSALLFFEKLKKDAVKE